MPLHRRHVLGAAARCGALAPFVVAGLISPSAARAQQAAWNRLAFESKGIGNAVQALGGQGSVASDAITISAKDLEENGAAVPITISTTLPNVTQIAIAVEKNPNTLAALFELPPGTEPFIGLRIKMGETSNVIALVKSDGRWFMARKYVEVVLGGCIA